MDTVLGMRLAQHKREIQKTLYRTLWKAFFLMIGGIITFLIGICLAIWYFTRKYMTADEDYPWHDPSAGEPDMHKIADMMAEYERKNRILLMVGPIIIASGLLLTTCGGVWIPVARQKEQQTLKSLKARFKNTGLIK